jgi:DNA invertase Pin-like site-specific DNA recombinase
MTHNKRLIGYIGLTPDQLAGGMSAPHNALISFGVARLYIDIKNGTDARPQLDAALAELSPGDVLVSPSVNMLTDSIAGLLAIHSRVDAAGGSLRLLELAGGLPLDTSTVEGRAILSALAVMNMLPPVGPVPGRAAGPIEKPVPGTLDQRPRGRPATAGNQAQEVNRLRAQGLRAIEIAACLGIGRASVYRILNQGETAALPPKPTESLSARIVGRFSGT